MGILKTFVSQFYINWMPSCGKTTIRSNKNIIPKNHRSRIEYHKIMVRIEIIPKRYVATVIAPKGRFYNKIPFSLANYITQYSFTLLYSLIRQCIILLTQLFASTSFSNKTRIVIGII